MKGGASSPPKRTATCDAGNCTVAQSLPSRKSLALQSRSAGNQSKTTEGTHEAQSAVIPRPKSDIQLAEAFALADRLSVKPVDFDRSQHSQATETTAPTTERSEPLTALLLTANDTGEISALSGKVVALNDSLTGSAALIRTAIVAAGAPNVQLSDSQEAPVEALRRGEISAAVLGVVTADRLPDELDRATRAGSRARCSAR
jgi:hypothetical protein